MSWGDKFRSSTKHLLKFLSFLSYCILEFNFRNSNYMNLCVRQVLLWRLPHLEVFQGQLRLILDKEGCQDGPVLACADIV